MLGDTSYRQVMEQRNYLELKTKLLAWGIFLIFFIDSGTLGLVPSSYYLVYRNIRISDLLMYFLIIYSVFNLKDFAELYKSKTLLIIKLVIFYLFIQFVLSVILYEQNFIEYFFRLKALWSSFLILPFIFLVNKKGLPYLIKLMLPVAVISNVLYLLSYITGIALMPDTSIEIQNLPGGLQVNRVFGGTFYGELFFLGFIFKWITDRVRLYQVFLAMLFVTPHILAFGRAGWIFMSFTILMMLVWNFLKKREFKILIRQAVVIALFGITLVYTFTRFFPQSEYIADAIEARVEQGQENIENKTGTYGTRLANSAALIELWLKSGFFFGVGMHPMIVIRPTTNEEAIYVWGFSDVRWAALLAAYGLVGFLLAVIFQLYYIQKAFSVLKRTRSSSIYTFFILVLLSNLLFDTLINFSYYLVSVRLWGINQVFCFYLAILAYKNTHIDE